jgi:hypothetical protein
MARNGLLYHCSMSFTSAKAPLLATVLDVCPDLGCRASSTAVRATTGLGYRVMAARASGIAGHAAG